MMKFDEPTPLAVTRNERDAAVASGTTWSPVPEKSWAATSGTGGVVGAGGIDGGTGGAVGGGVVGGAGLGAAAFRVSAVPMTRPALTNRTVSRARIDETRL